MKKIIHSMPIFLPLALFAANTITVHAQSAVFTYQGLLMDAGQPANGTNYGMVFYLYDAPVSGNQLGNLGIPSITVSNGLFTTPLSYNGVFNGNPRWLEIAVQKDGGAFTTLTPRQQITPAPYAIFANTASNLSSTVPLAQLPAAVVTNNASSVTLKGAFTGNGNGLTNLNATSLIGTVPIAQLPASAALVNSNQTFTGSNGFSGTLAASKWKVTTVIENAGPLPITSSFSTSGGTLLIFVSGSAYSGTAGASIGMTISIDGTSIDSLLLYANSSGFHLPFVSKTVIKRGLAAGSHSLTLTALSGTTTDLQDNFDVTVQELPF